MEKFIPLFIFLVAIVVVGLFIYIAQKKSSPNNRQKSQARNSSSGGSKPSSSEYQDPVKRKDIFSPVRTSSVPSAEEQEARKRQLDAMVNTIRGESQNKPLSLDDISSYTDGRISPSEIDYIAKQLPTPFFSVSVWDLHQKIMDQSLTDDQILSILGSGTENISHDLIDAYGRITTWTMSSTLFSQLISNHPLALFHFIGYSKDMLTTIINRLSAYELLGYRMKPKNPAEQFSDSFLDLQKSTEDDEIFIEYYESAHTDMLHFIEENYPNETEARAKAFAKILSGSSNIIAMINRVGDFGNDEMKKIIARNHPSEISALFDACAASDVANCFPPLYAVKAALEIIECEYSDEIKDKYLFTDIPTAFYQEVITSLSADELLGYDARGQGNYDIIKLFEDNSIEDEAIRQLAFEKMSTSKHLADAIGRWDTVTEYEIAKIMERGVDEHVNAFFERDDSTAIGNIPEEMAIKIVLQIRYPDFAETVKDNYSFASNEAFLNIINELSPYELLGLRTQANAPDETVYTTVTDLENDEEISIYHDAEYDIIALIENEMSDDIKLRIPAFAKVCEAKNMVDAITRWENVQEDEIAKIMERGYDAEINALLGRDDSETIIENLPQEVAIKVALELMYEDAAESVRDNYSFSDKGAFLNVIKELSAYELLGFRTKSTNSDESTCNILFDGSIPDKEIPIYHDAEYDIISLIENDMSDDSTLRAAAFAKMCESKNMEDAIGRWENVQEDEIAKIMERGNEEEIDALLGRDDSESIIENLPQEVAIKVALELMYEDSAETVRNSYSFSSKEAFITVIKELTAYELLGFRIQGEGSYDGTITNLQNPDEDISIYHDAEYDIISLIENDMNDDNTLRAAAFAKMCQSKNMVDAITRWTTVTDNEIAKIIERGYEEEIDALLEREDADDMMASLPDNFIIRQHMLSETTSFHDEYNERIVDETFQKKVQKFAKKAALKEIKEDEKDASSDDLSDGALMRAMLGLIDFDECSFDIDDVTTEYDTRMSDNEKFKQGVESFVTLLT